MESLSRSLARKLSVLIAFAAMVVVNWLSVVGKINNISPAEVSAMYPTLVTPKGYTFSIWGIIYLFLFVYVLFQLFSRELATDGKLSRVSFWFVFSSIMNAGWIFAWHYQQIIIATILMVLLLFGLTRILTLIAGRMSTFGGLISLEIPFGLYAGWITVATVANISVLLVDLGWDGFGIPAFIWLIVTILIATLIAISATRQTMNIAYPAAVIWGYVGIFTRYLPGFSIDVQKEEMWIVLTFVLCLVILIIRWIDILIRRLR